METTLPATDLHPNQPLRASAAVAAATPAPDEPAFPPGTRIKCEVLADYLTVIRYARMRKLDLRPNGDVIELRQRTDATADQTAASTQPRAARRPLARLVLAGAALAIAVAASALFAHARDEQQPLPLPLVNSFSNEARGYGFNYPADWVVRIGGGGGYIEVLQNPADATREVGIMPPPATAGLVRFTTLSTETFGSNPVRLAQRAAVFLAPTTPTLPLTARTTAVVPPVRRAAHARFRGVAGWTDLYVLVSDNEAAVAASISAPTQRMLRELEPTWHAMVESLARSMMADDR